MKRMRKLQGLTLLLIFALLITSFTGCGNPTTPAAVSASSTTTPSAAAQPASEKPPEAKAIEPIHVTWMHHVDLAINKSWTTTQLPELLKKYGFDVSFEIIEMGTHDSGEWYTKFNTMVASGEAPPDIIHTAGLQMEAIDAGWYMPLQIEQVQTSMPKYYDDAMRIYDKLFAYGRDSRDGTLYGLVSWNMFGPNRHTFVYRKDWLDKMGLKVPVTIEDFEQFLKMSRTIDFNGNNEFDEYGYTSGSNSPGAGFSEVFGAYGTLPLTWLNKDGKIVRGEVIPEAREALTTLARWYSEDLIPKGVGTTETRRDGFNQGIRGSYGQADGYSPALVEGGQNFEEFKKLQPEGEMAVSPSFKGPRGEWGTQQWGPRKYTIGFGAHLAKEPEKLETILRMLETIATEEELFVAAMLGEQGTHWSFNDPNATTGATKFLEPYTEFNKRLDEVGVREMSESAFCPIWVSEVYNKYLDPLAIEYASQNPGYYDALMGIPFDAVRKYGNDLDALTKEVYLDIITGKKPIEAFDDYVTTWMENGGEEMTKAANDLYANIFK